MILNDFTVPTTKFSNEKLDSVLADLCEIIIRGQQDNPDFNGMVAAAVIDPTGRIVTGLNYLYGARRVHGERAAIDKYEAEYGDLPRGSVVVTTCSPCSCEFDDNREGPSCSELLNRKGVKLAYCGFNDPTQKNTHDKFVTIITENSKLKHLCQKFADTFLHTEKIDEISADRLERYLARADQQVSRRMDRMSQARERLSKNYEIYHADRPAGSSQIVDRFDADTPELARQYYEKFIQNYDSDVDFDLRLRKGTGIIEDMPTGARAPLYHTSPITKAIKIIDDGAIKPITPFDSPDPRNPNTGKPSISLTRDPRLNYYSTTGGSDRVTFVIDQDSLRQITKIYPITYPGIKRQESEERVYNPIPLSVVTAIIVPKYTIEDIKEIKRMLKDRGDWIDDEVWNEDSYDRIEWMLDYIMQAAKKQGIKIIVK